MTGRIQLRRAVVCALLAMGLLIAPAAAREKSDVITLNNGDRVTGEIKQLMVGTLTIKTHLMDTIEIDWVGVTGIESPQLFEVEDTSGAKHFGTIGPSEDGGLFVVHGSDGDASLGHDQISTIVQIEESLLRRWNGHVNLGFNLTAANSASNLTLDAETTYRSQELTWSGTLSSTISDRDDAARTARTVLATSFERTIKKNLFWTTFAQLENNQELNLDLRATLGAGFGRYMIRNVRSELSLVAAVTGNRESYSGEDKGAWGAELLLGCRYDLFLFGGHKTRLSTTLGVLPSLTTSGRYRIELNGSLSRKITNDLSVSLSLYDSYDSHPPSETSASDDWGVTTSLGWTF